MLRSSIMARKRTAHKRRRTHRRRTIRGGVKLRNMATAGLLAYAPTGTVAKSFLPLDNQNDRVFKQYNPNRFIFNNSLLSSSMPASKPSALNNRPMPKVRERSFLPLDNQNDIVPTQYNPNRNGSFAKSKK